MTVSESTIDKIGTGVKTGFFYNLNTIWHKRALQFFMLIVLARWAEHLAQAVQIFILNWSRPQSNGVLGLFFLWLVRSEALHYGYAIVMLIGLFMLRKGSPEPQESGGTFRWQFSSGITSSISFCSGRQLLIITGMDHPCRLVSCK